MVYGACVDGDAVRSVVQTTITITTSKWCGTAAVMTMRWRSAAGTAAAAAAAGAFDQSRLSAT